MEQALILYELYLLTKSPAYADEALALYRKLWEIKPDFEYKKRIMLLSIATE
jgi:hypothetical protein